ncbi:MAG: ATP-binding cassette domain-containing protein [Candidatus Pacebacteria bacterium]|nr:ATP-binding cassette domain-containing protein [Candidatus Paceibacterota bacterium]
MKNEVILRFNNVSFGYREDDLLLKNASFTVRKSKIAIMGQNGAGKSTIFKLMNNELKPDLGAVNINGNISIGVARQFVPKNELDFTLGEFFEKYLNKKEKVYDIDLKIDNVLKIVNLKADHDRIIRTFSGGQQSRLLLASALIQNPDLLLLDEPTNNLDKEGIAYLKEFLMAYGKSCIVISHDTEFLNSFTNGVLYLNEFTKQVEQYTGNYIDVRDEILARKDKGSRKNALLSKKIRLKKERISSFENKGGKMRLLAKRMRKKVSEYEEEKVELRREDKTIHKFNIPCQENISGIVLKIEKVRIMKNNAFIEKKVSLELKKNEHLLIKGPNGIGNTSLLEALVRNREVGLFINPNVNIGYYRQDFSTLNFEDTVYKSLSSANKDEGEVHMRSIAAGFLITSDLMEEKIGDLSEGQKGLLSFARLVLMKPGLLIFDEPTNHINFRHIPVIAKAISEYKGAMVLVSHMPEFVGKIRIDYILDFEK